MMAKTLQGTQQQYAASGFPTQQYPTSGWTQSAAEILQLDNMDQDTSVVRNIIHRKM
jgi:hypothetical protein